MKIGIIDVWTQYFSPTPPEKRTAAAENVFRNYGRLDWYHNGTNVAQMLDDMDRNGVQIACISGEAEHVREAVRQHPDRFIGEYHADPTNIMAAVRGLQEHVEKYGFKVLRIEPFMWGKPPTDPCYYPLYAKCIELDVAFQTQVGHTGPLYPVRDRPADLHRQGRARLSRAAHHLRPHRLAVDRGDDRRRLEARQRLHRHLGARAQALSRTSSSTS